MLIKTSILTLITDKRVVDSATTLRGFIAGIFSKNPLVHHHSANSENKSFIYSYPKIQYKILEGNSIILGIDEAVEVVKEISNIDYLDLKGKRYAVTKKKAIEQNVSFDISEKIFSYKLLTPWLALDEESYKRYKIRNLEERKKQLESIIIGNIISMAKGLEYVITNKISATVDVREITTSLKGTSMLGFLGGFSVNFEIPDYWGIGKSVSRGFGTVIRQKA